MSAPENEVPLSSEDRLRLLRFACAFAWADLEVAKKERRFVADLAKGLGATEEELAQVKRWLKVPPDAEDIDPTEIPPEHRQLFLNAAVQMISADGRVDSEEVEILSLFEQLLR
jgi:tellurite resistance protein